MAKKKADQQNEADAISAVEYLEAQHREVEELFEAISNAEDPAEKQDLFDTIADKLAIHAKIEEQFFYPAVRERKTEDMILEAYVEHTSVKRLLADLLETEPGDELFDAKIKVLQEQIEHHVEEEEDELFPAAKKLLSRDELLAIAQEMAALQDELEGTEPRNEIPQELQAQQPSV
jgi:hemerythrin superfamily protein